MLAILPAGGRATRFGGIHKDMLPIGEGKFLLSSAIERAAALGADRHLVISSPEKIATHYQFIEDHVPLDYRVTLVERTADEPQLWDAIKRTLGYSEDSLLLLPDTVWQTYDPLPTDCDLAIGLFRTEEAYRFSAVENDAVITKNRGLTGQRQCWGCIYWSKTVARYWRLAETETPYFDFDRALEDAMRAFGYKTFDLLNYHDLGTWPAYQRFVVEDYGGEGY